MTRLMWKVEKADKSDSEVLTCIPIVEYARIVNRSITAIRHLVLDGNRHRKMMSLKVHGHLYIPEIEIEGYPHVDPGVINERVYHDRIVDTDLAEGEIIVERCLCERCSYSKHPCKDAASSQQLYERFKVELTNDRPLQGRDLDD